MKVDIDRLTEAELIDLNHRVVERLRFIHQAHAHAAMLQFTLGEQVCFESGTHGRVTGTLMRYNKKTVTIITPDGQRWNVAPGLLQAARPDDFDVAVVPAKTPPLPGK